MEAQGIATLDKGPTDVWLSTLRSQLSRVDNGSQDYVTTLQRLRDERLAVESVLRILDSRINMYTPIARLPNELLLSIFLHLVCAEQFEHIPSMLHVPRTVPWVRFAWVCRRWRHVMLTSPALWRHFVLPLPAQWARTLLARSQQMPIIISCSSHHLDYAATSPEWRLPFDTLERVKTIDLLHFKGTLADIVPLLCTAAPILEVAKIYSDHPVTVSTRTLFADCAPRLHELAIRHTPAFTNTSSFMRNLISLDITHYTLSYSSVPQFLAVLQQLSRVETLVIKDCLEAFGKTNSGPLRASQTAQLPSLRKLAISGLVSECVGFLRHIQTPDTIELHVASSAPDEDVMGDFSSLYPFIVPTRGYAERPFRAVCFQSKTPLTLLFTASHTYHGPHTRAFEFKWVYSSYTIVDLVRALFKKIGAHHLWSLSIRLDMHRRADDFVHWAADDFVHRTAELLDMLGGATELRRLEATEPEATALCMALSATKEENGEWRQKGPGAVLAWPRLHDLLFERKTGYELAWMLTDHALLDALERRHRHGTSLDTLHLLGYEVDPHCLRKLEGIVGRVVVENRDAE